MRNERDFIGGLAEVKDPSATFAQITRQDYNDYINNFREFEKKLLEQTNDTSLIDQARLDAPKQNKIAQQVNQRNIERYGGGGLSNVQRMEQERGMQRGGQLNLAGNVNNARIQQREINQALLNDLIGIGQGVNSQATQGLGNASAMASNRRNAYKNAKTQYNNGLMGLGTTMLLAAMSI
jgi:hypothetical protein